ncbi:hypothetical protein TNCV_3819381 [Trichonephila clavipes]|nr:hypothetical protein TNCV_3819381 [Trichonephila clavipes]
MAQMETDPPDITNSCEERNRLSLEIEALDIVINRCTELVNFPDTDDNHEMKAILRDSIDDTQRKKDTMFYAKIVEVEIGGAAIYRPLGEFPQADLYCHLYGAQGQRQAYFQPLVTMNFVGLDMTTSDRWH